jgi:hypothetical protein
MRGQGACSTAWRTFPPCRSGRWCRVKDGLAGGASRGRAASGRARGAREPGLDTRGRSNSCTRPNSRSKPTRVPRNAAGADRRDRSVPRWSAAALMSYAVLRCVVVDPGDRDADAGFVRVDALVVVGRAGRGPQRLGAGVCREEGTPSGRVAIRRTRPAPCDTGAAVVEVDESRGSHGFPDPCLER